VVVPWGLDQPKSVPDTQMFGGWTTVWGTQGAGTDKPSGKAKQQRVWTETRTGSRTDGSKSSRIQIHELPQLKRKRPGV